MKPNDAFKLTALGEAIVRALPDRKAVAKVKSAWRKRALRDRLPPREERKP